MEIINLPSAITIYIPKTANNGCSLSFGLDSLIPSFDGDAKSPVNSCNFSNLFVILNNNFSKNGKIF